MQTSLPVISNLKAGPDAAPNDLAAGIVPASRMESELDEVKRPGVVQTVQLESPEINGSIVAAAVATEIPLAGNHAVDAMTVPESLKGMVQMEDRGGDREEGARMLSAGAREDKGNLVVAGIEHDSLRKKRP